MGMIAICHRPLSFVVDVGELEKDQPEDVLYSEALRSELARRLSAAAQRVSSSCLSCSVFNDCPVRIS